MPGTLIVGNEGNYAEVTAAGKLKVETDAELTLTNIETEITGTLDVQGAAAHDAVAVGKPVQVGGVYRSADPVLVTGDVGSLRINAKGELIVSLPATPAGTNLIGKVGIDQTTDGTTNKIYVGNTIQITGNTVAEVKTDADATLDVITFAANIASLEIWHDETTAQEFVVNGLTLVIGPGGWRSPIGGVAAATVGIPVITCVVTRLT